MFRRSISMKTKARRVLAAVLAAIMAAVFLPACSSSAAVSKPALVSKVTEYGIDYGSEEKNWTESKVYEYEYKDAYPASLRYTENGETAVTEYKYEISDGKPVSLTYNTPYSNLSVNVSYTKKGLVNRIRTFDETGRKVGEQVFQYGNRDEYFTLVLHENIISAPEDPVADHMEEIDSVIVSSQNGLLSRTVNDGLFANYNDNEEKIWRRFDGTYTANYDKNGILESTSALFKTFPGSGDQYKFDITSEGGRVTQVIRSTWAAADPENSSEGSWEPEVKYEFEYSDTEIGAARYASMINWFLLDGGSNYYIYNWY